MRKLSVWSDRTPARPRGICAPDVSGSPIPPNDPTTQSSNSPIQGFTLIELMVVISLLVILASMGLVQYRHSIEHAQEAVLRDDLYKVRDAIDQYYADKNSYPDSLDELVSAGYIRAIPKDPITKSEGTWQTVMSEPDAGNPTAQPGVYDIKSGADGTAMDGSKYSDW
jgi:general secretion pathway protein G